MVVYVEKKKKVILWDKKKIMKLMVEKKSLILKNQKYFKLDLNEIK